PQAGVRNGQLKVNFSRALGDRFFRFRDISRIEMDAQISVSWRRIVQSSFHRHGRTIHIRQEVNTFQRYRWSRFQIDGLPDAPGIAVALFAFQLEGSSRIVHAQNELVFLATLEPCGQLELKGRVTTAMGAQGLAVNPRLSLPIASADDEEGTLAVPFRRDAQAPRIPGQR